MAATDDWTGGLGGAGLGWAVLGCILSAAIDTAWVSGGHRTIPGPGDDGASQLGCRILSPGLATGLLTSSLHYRRVRAAVCAEREESL